MLNETIEEGLRGAREYKWLREYGAYVGSVNAKYKGVMQSILESDRKPKQKNVEILKAMVENQLAIECLTDNINFDYPHDTVGGLEVSK